MIDFSFDSYRRLLRHIQRLGHAICPLHDVPTVGPFVILRHDIDYSVAKALEMAEIEHGLGVRATVFLMFSSPYYNLMDGENLRAAKRIAGLGHEIGFHYDTNVFDERDETRLARAIADQAVFLSETIGTPVTSVAQHNPSVTATRVKVPGFTDAYDDRYVREIAYLSDSRRLFGAGDPFRFFEEHDRSQLLIHPLWWHDGSKTRREAFADVRRVVLARIEAHLDRITTSMEEDERRLRSK